METKNTCCFFGHRKIEESDALKNRIYDTVEDLIVNKGVDTFLFGSRSNFDYLCRKIAICLKPSYPHIKRIYIRAEFPYINDDYKNYLLKYYDDTYFPGKLLSAGKSVYVERNHEMIDKSEYCIFYYDENQSDNNRRTKSGTKLAFDYALKKGKCIINLF